MEYICSRNPHCLDLLSDLLKFLPSLFHRTRGGSELLGELPQIPTCSGFFSRGIAVPRRTEESLRALLLPNSSHRDVINHLCSKTCVIQCALLKFFLTLRHRCWPMTVTLRIGPWTDARSATSTAPRLCRRLPSASSAGPVSSSCLLAPRPSWSPSSLPTEEGRPQTILSDK